MRGGKNQDRWEGEKAEDGGRRRDELNTPKMDNRFTWLICGTRISSFHFIHTFLHDFIKQNSYFVKLKKNYTFPGKKMKKRDVKRGE